MESQWFANAAYESYRGGEARARTATTGDLDRLDRALAHGAWHGTLVALTIGALAGRWIAPGFSELSVILASAVVGCALGLLAGSFCALTPAESDRQPR